MVKMGNRKIKVTYIILTMIKTIKTMVKMVNRKIKVTYLDYDQDHQNNGQDG